MLALPGKYASSAFVAAANKDAKTLEKVEQDMKSIKQLVTAGNEQARKIKEFIENPTLSTSAKTKGINDLLGGKESEVTRCVAERASSRRAPARSEKIDSYASFLFPSLHPASNLFDVLAAHGRLSETERVIDGFLQLMSAHRGEVEVVVTSAAPLDKSLASRLESAIKGSQYASKGKSVKITQKVNPSIQGGLVVDFGDRTVDLSVSSRVNRLNTMLQQGV